MNAVTLEPTTSTLNTCQTSGVNPSAVTLGDPRTICVVVGFRKRLNALRVTRRHYESDVGMTFPTRSLRTSRNYLDSGEDGSGIRGS